MKKIVKLLLLAMLISVFASACGSTAPEVFDMDFTMNSSGMDLDGVTVKYIRSPIFGGGGFNSNFRYDWSWYLARTENGEWVVLTWGVP